MDKDTLAEIFYDSIYDDNFDEFLEAEKNLRSYIQTLHLPRDKKREIEDCIDGILKEYYLDDIIFKGAINNIYDRVSGDRRSPEKEI